MEPDDQATEEAMQDVHDARERLAEAQRTRDGLAVALENANDEVRRARDELEDAEMTAELREPNPEPEYPDAPYEDDQAAGILAGAADPTLDPFADPAPDGERR